MPKLMLTNEELTAIEAMAESMICRVCGGSGYIQNGLGSVEPCGCDGFSDTVAALCTEVRQLRKKNEALKCCGNCPHYVYSMAEAVYWCENNKSMNHGIPPEPYENCDDWETR